MTDTVPPMCVLCSRYKGPVDDTETCDAFSEIPDEIFYEAGDHRASWLGDNGKRFVPVSLEAVESVSVVWG